MKLKSYSLLFCVLFSSFALAQDSAMQAAPGSPPPPQGWTAELPPNGGIHLPPKGKKKMKMVNKPTDQKMDTEASPSPAP